MKIMEKLENLFAAVAFAEEGETETAIRMVEETKGRETVITTPMHTCQGCDATAAAK